VKILSIREPWAWAIFYLGKDVENRTWSTSVRGWIYIHTSKTFDMDGYRWIQRELGLKLPAVKDFKLGGIIGLVELIDCVKKYDSKWFFGPYGFIFKNPEILTFRRCRGQLGFFDYEYRDK
jgi:hypothetical protein